MSDNEPKQPDPRKVGQNPTGRETRSSAGRRRRAEKKLKAQEGRNPRPS